MIRKITHQLMQAISTNEIQLKLQLIANVNASTKRTLQMISQLMKQM